MHYNIYIILLKKDDVMNITFVCDTDYFENGYTIDMAKCFFDKGDDVRIILPFSKNNNAKDLQYVGELFINISINKIRILMYHGYIFNIPALYLDIGDTDNRLIQQIIYSNAVITAMDRLSSYPDYLFTSNQNTALIPILLKLKYRKNPFLSSVKTLHYINNISFDSYSIKACENLLGIDNDDIHIITTENEINFTKGAIICSNRVFVGENSISILYDRASNVHHAAVQFGFKIRKLRMGISYRLYSPEHDKNIAYNYDSNTIKNKRKNKRLLQKYYGFTENDEIPLIAVYIHHSREMIYRFEKESKRCNMQVIFINTCYSSNKKTVVSSENICNEDHIDIYTMKNIFAGCDFAVFDELYSDFGNPSYIASAYGCVPIIPLQKYYDHGICYFNKITLDGNGYTYDRNASQDMLYTFWDALGVYKHDKKAYQKLVQNCMKKAFPVSDAAEILRHETEKTSYLNY